VNPISRRSLLAAAAAAALVRTPAMAAADGPAEAGLARLLARMTLEE
jgi:hypothetical protein